jgi:iron complex outermembrane receptor protein
MHRKFCLGASAIAMALAASPVLAQGAPQSDAGAGASADVGGDIIVTAQRRSERLRDVPIAVTALSGEALERLHANNISRVEFATPGFTWGSQGSDSFPAIRGVRTSLVSAQTDPVIGFYVDGIYQSRTQQQSIPLFDMARVEVLRGPQGTLYGRNTFGGNVSIVTSDPTKDLRRGHQYRQGQFQLAPDRRLRQHPRVRHAAAARVRRVPAPRWLCPFDHLGRRAERSERERAARGVKWKPDSRLEVTLRAGTWRRDDAGAGSYGYKVAGTLINPATGYQSINGSPWRSTLGAQRFAQRCRARCRPAGHRRRVDQRLGLPALRTHQGRLRLGPDRL